jgi:ATP-binding cassette subfamily F protein 3
MLIIRDLTYRIGGRAVLDGASADLPTGSRTGLVGRNGAGKSTLLKLITGALEPDGGEIETPRRARLAAMSQQAPEGPQSVLDTVLAADTRRVRLLAEAEAAEAAGDAARISEAHEQLADIDAHAAPARAAVILAGLGFDEAAQAQPCDALSGGWRMRVALAAVLFADADILLLDEPSNHLDLESTIWLQSFLARVRGTLLIVSHDRDLLDAVCDRTVHIAGGKLAVYAGGYSQFERQRAARAEGQVREAARMEQKRAHLQSFVDRFRAKATKARQAQSRLKMLERMEPAPPPVGESVPSFAFPDPGPMRPPLVVLDGAAAAYGDNPPVLTGVGLVIDTDERIALLGRNGNGKSTMARLIAGRLAPAAGERRAANALRIGYFAQHQSEELDANATPLAHVATRTPDWLPVRRRAHLGRFGFSGDMANLAVGKLSGGEVARLLFALISLDAPHLLILDEPTNHLDVEARDAFAEALNAFPGAVVLIAHDARLIELCAERLYLVADGACTPYDGDMDEYRRLVLSDSASSGREGNGGGARRRDGPSRRDEWRAAAERRTEAAALRRAVKDSEAALEKLTVQRTRLEMTLADPQLYEKEPNRLPQLLREQGELIKRIEKAEARWLAAQEALEKERAE